MEAAKIGLKAGIRTFAQCAAGSLTAISVAPMILTGEAMTDLGNAVAYAFVGSAIAGVAAGLQNLAENL